MQDSWALLKPFLQVQMCLLKFNLLCDSCWELCFLSQALCCISSLSARATPDCSNEKLTLQLGIKPSSLCDARGLLFTDKVNTFGSSSTLEIMIIISQVQNQGGEDAKGMVLRGCAAFDVTAYISGELRA